MPIRRRMALTSVERAMMSAPSTRIEPADGSSRRLQQRSSVLFPDPDGPITNTSSCAWTARSMPCSTSVAPKVLRRPRMSRIGGFSSGISYRSLSWHGICAPSPPSGGEGRGEWVYPRVLSLWKHPSPRPSPRKSGARERKRSAWKIKCAGAVPISPARRRVWRRIVARHVGHPVTRKHGHGRGAGRRRDAEPLLVHFCHGAVELHALDDVLERVAHRGGVLARRRRPDEAGRVEIRQFELWTVLDRPR